MKKNNSKKTDELRAEYKRSDFGPLERGKYANRAVRETNIIGEKACDSLPSKSKVRQLNLEEKPQQ